MARGGKRNWTGWRYALLFFFFVNLGAALQTSRLTALRSIRVVGVPDSDQKRISKILRSVYGLAWRKVNEYSLKTEVMRNPSVEDVTFTHDIFGRATLEVTYRTAVARLEGRKNLGIDKSGIIFVASKLEPNLIPVSLPDSGPPTSLTFLGVWQTQQVLELVQRARGIFPTQELRVVVDKAGNLGLDVNGDSGETWFDLGTFDDLKVKIGVLDRRIKADPTELTRYSRVRVGTSEFSTVTLRPGFK
jgi:cell division septal protein FtsQ